MRKGCSWLRVAVVLAPAIWMCAAGSAQSADKPKPDEMVNNPPYENWSQFPVGTTVAQKETIKLDDGSTVAIDIVSKLVSRTKEQVVVETTMGEAGAGKSDGVAGDSKTISTFPAKVKMSKYDTPQTAGTSVTEGTEAVAVQGKSASAEWTDVVTQKGNETTDIKVWTLKDVPGGIVRRTMVTKKDGQVTSSSTLELVEVKPGA